MSKKKLLVFEEASDEEVSFKTENEYAKKYDLWREKEEVHKLEQKYGPNVLTSDASVSSDSEDESDESPEVSEETETQFLKTLALLKTKDPRIYDPDYKFFDEKAEKEEEKKPISKTLTFEDSDDDEDGGEIFTVEKKAEIASVEKREETSNESSKKAKEPKIKEFLTGKAEYIDGDVERELAPLKALWSDPHLDEGEAFLRDYILNKRYLNDGDLGEGVEKLRDDEELEEDEKRVEEQGQFERAYNFRFEEPDQEFLKRFPRTMDFIRPKDDRRARKRAEVRERKEEEKRRKMEEIGRLKALKLKEIQEKIARIKEVTGNQDLAFEEEDIEGDFDPLEHDRRMRALFDEQYYGEQDQEKPVFPDLDEELEIENWNNYDPEIEREQEKDEEEPHCEDEDFNMDADYDPKQIRANLLQEIQKTLGKKRRNRKKKTKLAQLLATEKPKFVPTVADKTYDQYMEEYYKMDCEDVIGGDLPTRFKYREVVPNDYGLSIEEILLADDKELTQWVPLKKIVRHRPAEVEKSEVHTYAQKATDRALKKKILPSLFKDLPETPEIAVPIEEATKKKKKKKKNKKKESENSNLNVEETEENLQILSETIDQNGGAGNDTEVKEIVKNKKKKHKEDIQDYSLEVNESAEQIPKKKHKLHKNNIEVDDIEIIKPINAKGVKNKSKKVEINRSKEELLLNNEVTKNKKMKKKKHKGDNFVIETVQNVEPSQQSNDIKDKNDNLAKGNRKQDLKRKLERNTNEIPNKKKKKKNKLTNNVAKNKKKDFKSKQRDTFKNKQGKDSSLDNPLGKLSDERLKAYGLNPKKYRSFLKYKKF